MTKEPTEFLADTHVGKALHGLQTAVKAAIAERGSEMHFIMVIAQDKEGKTNIVRTGCTCAGCAVSAAKEIMKSNLQDGIAGKWVDLPRQGLH